MRVLGIVFSARKRGNCFHCVRYCIDRFGDRGFEVELLNVYDYDINPCNHCEYECFNREPHCPIDDDVPKIFKCIEETHLVILGIPDYGGHLSGLYRAFNERMQCMNNRQTKSWMEIPKGFIVVGNLSAGGDMVLHEVLYDFAGSKNRPEALLLSAREYGRYSLRGDLLESDRVRDRLNRFVEMLANKFKD